MRNIALLACSFLLLSACSMPRIGLPRVHKVTVQQGNVITQEMIDQLQPGMSRSQVAYIMGEPIFRHPFDDNRWDYIYTIEVPGYYEDKRHVSLFFENDLLAYFTGDYAPSEAGESEETEGGDGDGAASDATDENGSAAASSAAETPANSEAINGA